MIFSAYIAHRVSDCSSLLLCTARLGARRGATFGRTEDPWASWLHRALKLRMALFTSESWRCSSFCCFLEPKNMNFSYINTSTGFLSCAKKETPSRAVRMPRPRSCHLGVSPSLQAAQSKVVFERFSFGNSSGFGILKENISKISSDFSNSQNNGWDSIYPLVN